MTAQQRLFSFLPLGRCNQHYDVGKICIGIIRLSAKTMQGKNRACYPCDFRGKQALRSTSGSFAYGHFQLFNIDPDFGFTLGTVQREIMHHCVLACFGSGLAATDGTVNPFSIFLFVVHVRFLYIK